MRRAARRWAVRPRSTATSTTAASARISTPGRNSAIAAGAIPISCPTSSGCNGGTPVEVRASKEVILSGGTYNSPQVLQLSGVGSPELLDTLGIEVRHALPGVGEGLQDHYAPRTVARVKDIRTINEMRRGLSLWVEALKWATTRRGLLSLSPTMVYCFWHSGETTES